MSKRLLILTCVLLAANGLSLKAQEPVKPGAEHEILKKWEGTWNVTMTMEGKESKGTNIAKMDLGGLWLVSDFTCDLGGAKFQGKSMDTYDAAKKKYVSVWFDSMAPTALTMEGTHEKNVTTMTGEGKGPDGKAMKFKSTTTWKDDNTVHFVMYMGDEKTPAFTINYTRKK